MAAQRLGIRWGRSSVTALEAGVRELTATELLALPCIMLAAVSAKYPDDWEQYLDDVELAAFVQLDRSESLKLTETLALRREVLAGWFGKGKPVPPPRFVSMSGSAHLNATAVGQPVVSGEAERKLARTLGVEPGDVVAAAVKRWGRSLTEERDERVRALIDEDTPPRTVQARRGRVTRELRKELNLEKKG